jgi:hypothetical protein
MNFHIYNIRLLKKTEVVLSTFGPDGDVLELLDKASWRLLAPKPLLFLVSARNSPTRLRTTGTIEPTSSQSKENTVILIWIFKSNADLQISSKWTMEMITMKKSRKHTRKNRRKENP